MSKRRKEEILGLKNILVKRLEALKKALAGDLNCIAGQQKPGDLVDAALDGGRDDVSAGLAEVESKEIQRIGIALELIRRNTYGICTECESEIPIARLKALPYATTCIKCQREDERLANGFPATVPMIILGDDIDEDDRQPVLGDVDA